MNPSLRTKMAWQIAFRFTFLMAMGVSGAVLRFFYNEQASEILIPLLVSGLGFCIVSWIALRLLSERHWETFAWAQILGDIAYTSVLVYFTGGITSAFMMLYAVHILIAAALLSSRGAIGSTVAGVVGLICVVLTHGGLSSFVTPSDVTKILLLVSSLFLVGGTIAYFFKNREKLAESLERVSADLKDLGHLYSAIVDHIPSGILYLDGDGRIQLLNYAAIRILGGGWLGEPLDGTPLEVFLKPDGRFESNVPLRDGTKALGHHRTALPDGGSVVVFQDVTEFRDLERRMALKEKLASVGQLAAGIAHEIRNPLASLSGSIQLLKSELKLEPHYEKLMHIVLRETDRLDHLANNFLNYARPSEVNLEKVSLSKVVDDILLLARNAGDLKSKEIAWESQIPADLQCVCDSRQLKQILWNLVVNAIQAIPKRGRITLSAKVAEFEGEETVRVSVEDTGEGMNEELKAKIFDPFFTTKASGSGLGLALVYQIIKAHRGRLGVESEPGAGTVFWFEFFKSGPKPEHAYAA